LVTITFERVPGATLLATTLKLTPTMSMLVNVDGVQYNYDKLVSGFMIVTG